MSSLQMAIGVVVPMAIMMGIGVLLRLGKITDRTTMKKVDRIIYTLFTPALVFTNIYNTDFSSLTNPGFLLYGAAGLIAVFVLALILIPKFIPEMPVAAAFGQGIVRPNYVIFGAAVAQGIYGEGNIGVVMLMGAMSIPMINVMSAIILEMGRNGKASSGKLLLAILKNPILIAVFLGLSLNLSGLRLPGVFEGVLGDLGGLATPLSFLSIGVSLAFGASTRKRLLSLATALRLVILPLIFVVGGILLGFRGQQLLSLLILFGAPTAVSSYPMAVAMGADGELAGQLVAVSTLLCLPTIFLWTMVLNMLQLL